MSELEKINEQLKELEEQQNKQIDLSEENDQLELEDDLISEAITYMVTDCEATFNFTTTYPDFEHFSEKFSLSEDTLRQHLLGKVSDKLEKRGLPRYPDLRPEILPKVKKPSIIKNRESHFDHRFIMACNILLDTGNSKSFGAKMKSLEPLGVTTNHWNAWMDNPKYADYATTVFKKRFDSTLDMQADMALARNIQSGDLSSIKYYKELTGKFRPVNENNLAIATIIQIFMEIVGKHLSPEVIDTVAEELDSSPVGELMNGY